VSPLEHCGPVGAGSTMKLAINLPLMVSWQAFGEAFALTRDLGIDPERLITCSPTFRPPPMPSRRAPP